MARDYYDVLGVDRGASEDDIKKAYREKALEFHPDRNPGDSAAEEKFKEATAAYEVLHDAQKRQRYDQFGHAGVDGGMGGAGGFGGGAMDFQEIFRQAFEGFGGFEDLFGGGMGGARRRGPQQGRNLQVRLTLTLEEVLGGATKKIRLKRLGTCDTCNGSGARAGSSPTTCAECNGMGQVQRVQRSLLGQMVTVVPCPTCRGAGQTVTDPCPSCNGEGRREVQETISVDVPAGVSTGNYIPISGKGDEGPRGGPAGDLIVMIEEAAHDIFERDGDDIICDLPISFTTAALGGKVEVPTLGGSARLDIPSGTQSHKVFRLRGQGLPHVRSNRRGDQLVRVRVWTPKKLSREERLLIEKLAEIQGEPVPEPGKGVFERIRDAFR